MFPQILIQPVHLHVQHKPTYCTSDSYFEEEWLEAGGDFYINSDKSYYFGYLLA